VWKEEIVGFGRGVNRNGTAKEKIWKTSSFGKKEATESTTQVVALFRGGYLKGCKKEGKRDQKF